MKPTYQFANSAEEAAVLNNRTYLNIYYRLKNLAISMFEWENLPPSIDPRFLETTLFEFGYALYFNDESLGNLALTCMIGGELNVYRYPIYRRAYAVNGYQLERDPNNSVLIYNNYTRMPTFLWIAEYARRIYEIERAIDVNVKAQKTPTLISCNEKQRLTLKNLYMQYDGNYPFIFASKDLDYDSLKCLKTDAPFVAADLQVLKTQYWAEALTFVGINNFQSEKKERLVSGEVDNNFGQIEASRLMFLNARRDAVKQINRMFGTNIDVHYRSEITLPTIQNEDGGADHEQVYNGTTLPT